MIVFGKHHLSVGGAATQPEVGERGAGREPPTGCGWGCRWCCSGVWSRSRVDVLLLACSGVSSSGDYGSLIWTVVTKLKLESSLDPSFNLHAAMVSVRPFWHRSERSIAIFSSSQTTVGFALLSVDIDYEHLAPFVPAFRVSMALRVFDPPLLCCGLWRHNFRNGRRHHSQFGVDGMSVRLSSYHRPIVRVLATSGGDIE